VNLSIEISPNHTKNLLLSVSIKQLKLSRLFEPFRPTLESSSYTLNLPSLTLITLVIYEHFLGVSFSSSVDAESSEVLSAAVV